MNTKTIIFALAASASIACASGASASAQDAGNELLVTGKSVIVSYGDINLNSERGVEILDARIRNAVKKVCGGQPESNLLFGGPVRLCQRDTLARVQLVRNRIIADAASGDAERLANTSFTITRDKG